MSSFVVVDASIAIKWVVKMSDSSIAKALLADWTNKSITLLAPTLFAYEVCNALYKYVRAGQMSYEDAEDGLRQVIFPAVELASSEGTVLNMRALRLAHQFNLPATYDAHYLALAERESCECWTSDTRLWKTVQDKLDWVHNLNEFIMS